MYLSQCCVMLYGITIICDTNWHAKGMQTYWTSQDLWMELYCEYEYVAFSPWYFDASYQPVAKLGWPKPVQVLSVSTTPIRMPLFLSLTEAARALGLVRAYKITKTLGQLNAHLRISWHAYQNSLTALNSTGNTSGGAQTDLSWGSVWRLAYTISFMELRDSASLEWGDTWG